MNNCTDNSSVDLFNSPFDKHEERPHDAEGGHAVEQHGAAQPSPLHARHVQKTPL